MRQTAEKLRGKDVLLHLTAFMWTDFRKSSPKQEVDRGPQWVPDNRSTLTYSLSFLLWRSGSRTLQHVVRNQTTNRMITTCSATWATVTQILHGHHLSVTSDLSPTFYVCVCVCVRWTHLHTAFHWFAQNQQDSYCCFDLMMINNG